MCSHRLGCFTNCPPFGHTKERPISPLPWGSEVINTKFLLFTRENQNEYKEVSALDPAKVHESKFKSNRKTIFIIHGFLETGKNQWLVDMCKALLQVSDVNCFCVDWKGGSFAPYSQVANNARVVGAEIAHFLTYLLDNYNFSLLDVHLIGHSMGAHVAAEAGGRQRGIERITGLDPAGPYFSRTPPEVCLDKTDALFVDVIHTNAISIGPLGFGGFGVDHPVGNADFFPNGGKLQPGCDEISVRPGKLDDIMDDLMADVFCSHRRSCALFTASIGHPDGFYSYSAPTYNDFQKGAGFPCIDGDCNIMGYHVKYTHDEDIETNQTYYMNTGKPENLKMVSSGLVRYTLNTLMSRLTLNPYMKWCFSGAKNASMPCFQNWVPQM
ncbi:inactive pancreatic lipase-related protein 1-like isoform X2 [Hyperolius riggenbachi]|uniref:inactive pancreatic lipase-related protein 1-like isoform X2 n=1 Tax=Hyperolius riggenbachi TaxID=752182 RepID=UPI0035A3000F